MGKKPLIKILNIGCGYAKVTLPDVQEIRLDADPGVDPDIVLDIRKLKDLPKNSYDGVWCSHVLEHFYEHELPDVLAGIRHVLKKKGILFTMVPDLHDLFLQVMAKNISLDDTLYMSGMGPVRPRDILYGLQAEVETGNTFYSHKTGFDTKTLRNCLSAAGFQKILTEECSLQINAIACATQLPGWVKPLIKYEERTNNPTDV